jgi:hypothetical protein
VLLRHYSGSSTPSELTQKYSSLIIIWIISMVCDWVCVSECGSEGRREVESQYIYMQLLTCYILGLVCICAEHNKSIHSCPYHTKF